MAMIKQHANIYDYEKDVVRYLKSKWHSRIRNQKEFQVYDGESFDKNEIGSHDFLKVFLYVGELFRLYENSYKPNAFDEWSKEIRQEIMKWEQEGEMCLHISTLAYALFEKLGVFSDKEMKLVQGYFHHEARKDNPIAVALAKEHVAIHAWLSIKGRVIDFTIGQERQFFDFGDMDVIVGKVPEGMLLKGFQEPKKVVSRHTKRYAKYIRLTEDEWLNMHEEEATRLFEKVQQNT